ncbi:MAG: isochorismate synthase [Actinomycetia bacterium]|nr:isochorismate synthase [Actinomycetes bacterium]
MSYRVDELAAAVELSVDTVRYYQKLGLLSPPRRDGRVALYDESHVDRLDEIRRLSDSGFTLQQIKQLTSGSGDPRLEALATETDERLTLDDMVERTGLDMDLVRLAVDAGLVTPLPGSPPRFGPEAESMLRAAAAIIGSGLPVDELAALALRHADHVEEIVDSAIDIFRRHLPTDDPGEQAEAVMNLVPAVSELVSQHFRRTLLDRASARVIAELGSDSSERVLHCVSSEVAEPVDLIAVGHFVRDDHRFLWLRPGGGEGIITWGHVDSWSPGDGTAADFVTAVRRSLPDTPLPAVFVGGLAFDPERPRTLPWSSFGSGRLIFPASQLVRRDGRLVLMAFGENAEQARIRHDHALTMVEAAEHRGLLDLPDIDLQIEDHTADHYRKVVSRAVDEIEAGSFEKAVIARSIELSASVPLGAWLTRLRSRFPTCAIFARGEGSRTFFGATPEVLVRVQNATIETAALAGTRPRSDDPETDARYGDELRSSAKEQHEHTVVVDQIRSRLAAAGIEKVDVAETTVMKIPGIQHLYTPIDAKLPPGVGILDLVERLHPTPAVGGSPRDTALRWIRDNEELDRGWYAAPVGWTDTEGAGEFRVALRSALHGPERTILFAGCGIVAGSDPDDELEETRTKFGALLDTIGAFS